jgi:hypothetical protein
MENRSRNQKIMRSRLRWLPNRDQPCPQPSRDSGGPTWWIGELQMLRRRLTRVGCTGRGRRRRPTPQGRAVSARPRGCGGVRARVVGVRARTPPDTHYRASQLLRPAVSAAFHTTSRTDRFPPAALPRLPPARARGTSEAQARVPGPGARRRRSPFPSGTRPRHERGAGAGSGARRGRGP